MTMREADLEAEIRRLSGCLLVIAGAEGSGNGALRTAAYEASTTGCAVQDLQSRLGVPVPGVVRKVWARPLKDMPLISIDGIELTQAQAEAVRVAVTSFFTEVSETDADMKLGPVAGGYRDRLREVLKIMFQAQT